jgi:hypothetical protein
MTMSWRGNLLEPWSKPQRAVVLLILAGILIYGSIRLFINRSYVSDPQPLTPLHAAELADRIDPNTADAPTFSVLPLIGERRANDIIAYRQRYTRDHPGEIAFKSLDDLLKIRGVGLSTLDQIRPFLIFPKSSTTQPQK